MYWKRTAAATCRSRPEISRSNGHDRYRRRLISSPTKFKAMSNENLDFMHNALKYLGFGEHTSMNRELEDHVHEGTPDFNLETEVSFDGESTISARLYFHRYK